MHKLIALLVSSFIFLVPACSANSQVIAKDTAVCAGAQLASAVADAVQALRTTVPSDRDQWGEWGKSLAFNFGFKVVECAALLVSSPGAGTMSTSSAREVPAAAGAGGDQAKLAAFYLLDHQAEWQGAPDMK